MKLQGNSRRGRLAALALAGVSTWALLAGAAMAQADGGRDVVVDGRRPDTGIGRLPQPVEDLPQTVHVIDEQTLREQGATSLDRAVRNIPGITANTGEGGGAVAGDQFRIRGFDAANDIASDGLRDFGVYTRDTFNTESVQVFLGPSGATFGRGSFGGAINTSSKFATLDDASTVQGVVGTADLARFTADVNHQLGETSALRINVLAHHNAVDDIDEVEADRFGFAAAAGWGLGTDTSFQLMYFHQNEDRVPYYGVPVTALTTGAVGGPLPVDRSNFYGTSHDRDITQADVLTARFEHRFNEGFQIKNDTRFGVFDREFMAVAPSCNETCYNNVLAGDPQLVTRGGASGPYFLEQWGIQNITTAIADFEAFGFTHQFVAGLDLTYEEAERRNTSAYNGGTFPRPLADAYNPSPVWNNPAYITTNFRASESTDVALFVSEQVWLTEQFSLLASARWDEYEADSLLTTYGTVNTTTGAFTAAPSTAPTEISETLFSPRFSAIWEPGEHTIVYASWSRSEQPPTGTALASVGTPITGTLTALDPTSSETIEIGARFPLFNPNLLLGISLFQIERENAKQVETTGEVFASGDQQEAQGVEISLSGQISERWAVQASYTYLDTETTFAPIACVAAAGPIQCPVGVDVGDTISDPRAIGNPIPFAAEHSATLWTTYNATENLTLGFGARYTGEVFTNNLNTAAVPEYISFDAMLTYFFDDGLSLQINGANLADRDDNYDQVANSRAAHAPGRAFTVSLTKNF